MRRATVKLAGGPGPSLVVDALDARTTDHDFTGLALLRPRSHLR
ncbi:MULTISPECIES: hypothetical protein [Streptomyces]|nr:hypothetical protein [Streptomyces sp. CRPSP2-6A1]